MDVLLFCCERSPYTGELGGKLCTAPLPVRSPVLHFNWLALGLGLKQKGQQTKVTRLATTLRFLRGTIWAHYPAVSIDKALLQTTAKDLILIGKRSQPSVERWMEKKPRIAAHTFV